MSDGFYVQRTQRWSILPTISLNMKRCGMHFYAPIYSVFITIRPFRLQLGLVYVHLALDSQFSDIRKLAGSSVTEAMKRAPRQTGRIIREALSNFVARDPHAQKAAQRSRLRNQQQHAANTAGYQRFC